MLPGESTAIALTIDIDVEMAVELNQFRPRLEATLILHVGLGKDHFVTASANYGTFAELHLHTPRLFLLFFPFFPTLSLSFFYFVFWGEVLVSLCIGGFTLASIA